MTREDLYRKQAESQKKRIPRANIKTEIKQVQPKKELPSRGSVHRKKKKLKIPGITLLVIIFILLPISLFFILEAVANIEFSQLVPADPASKLFERVHIEQNDE